MTRLLDITRLIRRAGRPMTGIDRVEFAYLRELCNRDAPLFALARTRLGYVLLDKAGAARMAQAIEARRFGPLDALGKLAPRRAEDERRAEADLRRLAIARCLPVRLGAMLRRALPRDVRYLNTGHSNLTDRVLTALRGIDATVAVLIHDVIPLDAPEFQRAETVASFRRFLARAEAHADLLIYNSHDTKVRTEALLDRPPQGVVAHLGIEDLPSGMLPDWAPSSPYFVALGTIEPRKNHALLLDVWSRLKTPKPTLVVIGNRGWNNAEVFAQLDAKPAGIIEANGLDDAQMAALLRESNGLLFPSHLEGYGLPPCEAAMLGVPVVCQDLPVLRELLGNIPIYASGSDPYLWEKTIENLAEQRHTPQEFVPPTWTDHFNTVLMLT